jgi:iron complex transport system ATP-binding protein
MTEYYFNTKKLCVGYNGKALIKDIEINLNRGEILTLIGPNGAGKSTILKSIAGQLKTICGAVYLGKEELGAMPADRLAKKMAVVFTEKLRTELMTCRDVAATGRYPYTGYFGVLSEDDYRKVDEAMELVNVSDIKDREFTKISDGQRQRVMLARAVCQEPEIIILDEPTSFLDVKYKLEFLSLLQKLKKDGKLTVIMSLHELELAERVSDRILCVKGEYVEKYGKPEEIFKEGYINSLFDIHSGSFDEEGCSMELEKADAAPEVFVIAGGGLGRHIYRQLQRQGTGFATGILYENDLDYPAAKALAAEVIASKSFEPVTDELLESAKQVLAKCSRVICCKESFGTYEKANEKLLKYAKSINKTVEISENRMLFWQFHEN